MLLVAIAFPIRVRARRAIIYPRIIYPFLESRSLCTTTIACSTKGCHTSAIPILISNPVCLVASDEETKHELMRGYTSRMETQAPANTITFH